MKLRTLLPCLLALCFLCACGGSEESAAQTTAPEPTQAPYLTDNDWCSYELISSELDASGNYVWHIGLTNKSAQPLTFSMDEVYLNDLRADPYWAYTLEAGASAQQEVLWTAAELARVGITMINRVDFRLTAFPPSDSGAPVMDERLTSYPHGEQAYRYTPYTPASGERTILDSETARVFLSAGLQGDLSLRFHWENMTDMVCYLAVTELKVNGQAIDGDLRLILNSAKQGSMELARTREQLSALEIDTISGVTMQLAVCDARTDAVLWQDAVTLVP